MRELIRTGGFERSILVLATPTGTGWIDRGALDTVEYLHCGDIASVVRFANQEGMQKVDANWGHFRLVFLQYASDPITSFDPSMTWREPSWMQAPRGPDVTPDLRWFPLVTALHVAADMIVGTAAPGFGHEIAPRDYIKAWVALTEAGGWSADELQRLQELFDKEEDDKS